MLLNEDEVHEESAAPPKKTTEESFLQSNLGSFFRPFTLTLQSYTYFFCDVSDYTELWYGYLAYNEAEYKLLVEAKAKANSGKKPRVKRKK